jgi:hypothetical protein
VDYCNGTTHFWSDDSYDSGSYPCPGQPECVSGKAPVKAKDIALSAAEQAKAAAEAQRQAREVEELARAREKQESQEQEFRTALPILNEWFPGVEWCWRPGGDYDLDVIVWDASEEWPPSFKLKIESFKNRLEIQVGDYRSDSSMPGYTYFAGSIVRSAADIGRYLEKKDAGK